jgi:hypothetical protein
MSMVDVFGATSTTDEVLSGVNLRGKRILVTGVSAGGEGVRGYALDPNNAEALWKKSEEMVGEKF